MLRKLAVGGLWWPHPAAPTSRFRILTRGQRKLKTTFKIVPEVIPACTGYMTLKVG